MYSTVFLAGTALMLCLLITPLVIKLALRLDIVDRPDSERKLQKSPIPRIGGVAIAASYVLSFALLLMSPLAAGALVWQNLGIVSVVMPAATLVFLIGLVDDVISVTPVRKLLAQALAAVVAYFSGVQIQGIAGHETGGVLSLLITVLWLTFSTNAFNLLDGLDGLAAGLGSLAAATMFLAAALKGDVALCLATAPLVGCLIGFLRYNSNPASIYLGDSGSLLVGFLLGCFGVIWSYKSATLLGMVAPTMALAIPLTDTVLAIVRRFIRNRPIFKPDRAHLHHLMLERGMSPRRVAYQLYAVGGIAAALSLAQYTAPSNYKGLVLLAFLGLALSAVKALRLVELTVVRETLSNGFLQQVFNAQINLRHISKSLAQASTVDECWELIRHGARPFGMHAVRLEIGGRVLEQASAYTTNDWLVQVPLGGSGLLELVHLSHHNGPDLSGSFVNVVRRELNAKARLHARARHASAMTTV